MKFQNNEYRYLIYTWAENFRMRFPYLDFLIWVSIGQTFDFLLNPFFLGYSKHAICCLQSRGAKAWENARKGRKKSKPVLKIREFLQLLNINLKLRAKFQIYRLHIRDSDWLNFINYSGYKYKTKLVSILRKREDQALISISTIL